MAAATLARPGTLQAWIQPPASSKRKRGDNDVADDDSESAQDAVLPSNTKVPAFRKDTLSKEPARKKQANPKTKSTAAVLKAKVLKPTNAAKEAKKLYTESVKLVEKRYLALDKKVKAMNPNSRAITVSTYAYTAVKHLDAAEKLASTGETVLAFNFVMALGDASHRSIPSFRMSGDTGDCDAEATKLDEALLALIEKRDNAVSQVKELPEVPHRWTSDDADVGPFKTGHPNKQQRGQMDRHYISWEKERREARRTRRETCEDWIAVALSDLTVDRDYLKAHGIGEDFSYMRNERKANSYFAKSIAKLEELVAERSSAE